VPDAVADGEPGSSSVKLLVAEIVPGPVYACFDTAFRARMPDAAAHYALPKSWVRDVVTAVGAWPPKASGRSAGRTGPRGCWS
jgi:hypothetical protein